MKKKLKYLNFVTLFCLTTIGVIFFIFLIESPDTLYNVLDDQSGRNERSTPRSFVLPATPAVVEEQERRIKLSLRKNEIEKCMLKLYDSGFDDFDDFDDLSNFKITLSIIKYQLAQKIRVSGEFDSRTKRTLRC